MSEIEKYEVDIQDSVAVERRNAVEKITKESVNLVDELLHIIYNQELDVENRPIVDARTKLQAIGMLLDRGVPKLGVDHGKSDVVEESSSKKKLQKEIEELIKKSKTKEE